jgi:hypothetical protein
MITDQSVYHGRFRIQSRIIVSISANDLEVMASSCRFTYAASANVKEAGGERC